LTDPVVDIERQTQTARRRWLDPAWRASAVVWVETQLAAGGLRIVGPIEQPHIRPWSTAWSIPTSGGPVWFKAGGPGNAYEAGLLEDLARWRVPFVLEPIAVDSARGWILLPDGGTRLRDVLGGGPGLDHWQRILPEWGDLQRRLVPRVGSLVRRGLPDQRPKLMPAHLEALIEDPVADLSATDRDRLRAFIPTYARWCAELDALGIEPSLQHDDLHDGNVFIGEHGDRIFDWGDANIAHPFGTVLVTFRSIASRGLGDPATEKRALARLRDAYLEPWTAEHGASELASAVTLASRVAIVGRALAWRRALTGIPTGDHGAWAGNVGGWLLELFEPVSL
jgi:hypothetical protein